MNFFNNLINSLFDKKNRMKNLGFLFDKKPQKSLEEHIQNVYQAKGEISALIHSEELFNFLENSDNKVLINFFVNLEKNYDLELGPLQKTIEKYTTKVLNQKYL